MIWLRPCIAEFVGTFALCFIGIGAINNAGGSLLLIALAHGLAIAVMVSATMHISGGQLNPAVTFGLLLARKITAREAAMYIVSQLAGAITASAILAAIYGRAYVDIGTPKVALDIGAGAAITLEMVLTFFLVFVVFGTGVDERGRKIGGLAIGLTVAMDILAGGPLTGGAMNPARAFGPSLVAGFWVKHYVYWIGPLAGGALAGLLYQSFFLKPLPTTTA